MKILLISFLIISNVWAGAKGLKNKNIKIIHANRTIVKFTGIEAAHLYATMRGEDAKISSGEFGKEILLAGKIQLVKCVKYPKDKPLDCTMNLPKLSKSSKQVNLMGHNTMKESSITFKGEAGKIIHKFWPGEDVEIGEPYNVKGKYISDRNNNKRFMCLQWDDGKDLQCSFYILK